MLDLENSNVLITGGAGFVGSYIIEQLLELDVNKIVIVDNFVRGKDSNIESPMKTGKLKLIKGDIRDKDLLNEAMKGMDYCFHLAALRITQCAQEPREALETMYVGTFNVLEACVEQKVKKLVLASSASIYGHADEFPTNEKHHPYNNVTLYGAAKTANELMCRSFAEMYGLKFNALRYFNIYGPRMDTHGKYTEVLVRWYYLIKEGKSPLIYGDGKQSMDFIYIEEIAKATILALRSDICNEVYNVAGGKETMLEELCYALLKVTKSDLKPEYIALPQERSKVEVLRRLADTSKAKEQIGFEAKIGLEEGLTRLVQWLDQCKEKVGA